MPRACADLDVTAALWQVGVNKHAGGELFSLGEQLSLETLHSAQGAADVIVAGAKEGAGNIIAAQEQQRCLRRAIKQLEQGRTAPIWCGKYVTSPRLADYKARLQAQDRAGAEACMQQPRGSPTSTPPQFGPGATATSQDHAFSSFGNLDLGGRKGTKPLFERNTGA